MAIATTPPNKVQQNQWAPLENPIVRLENPIGQRAVETEARKFWMEVSRGGVEFEDNHPTTVLDTFLKAAIEDKEEAGTQGWQLLSGEHLRLERLP